MNSVTRKASRTLAHRGPSVQRTKTAKVLPAKAALPLSAEVQEIVRLARKLKGSFASA